MNSLVSPSNFVVSLALSAHAQAKTSRQQHTQPDQAKQAYLNALAVYATHFYLDCMAFDTEATDSKQQVQQTLLNSAALKVMPSGQQLECRPVLPTETAMFVPPEVQQDRMGYVAVQLSEDLRQATLLGFVETVKGDRTPLSQLQPMEVLTNQLAALIARTSDQTSVAERVPQPTRLSEWMNHLVEAGWQSIDNLLNDPLNERQLAWGFRSPPATTADTEPAASASERAMVQHWKHIQLQQNAEKIDIALRVGFFQRSTLGRTAPSSEEVEIWVKLYPMDEQKLLPASLQLLVLDDAGGEVMQAEARSTEAIQLKFAGSVGEQFGLKVVWQETSFVESFVI